MQAGDGRPFSIRASPVSIINLGIPSTLICNLGYCILLLKPNQIRKHYFFPTNQQNTNEKNVDRTPHCHLSTNECHGTLFMYDSLL